MGKILCLGKDTVTEDGYFSDLYLLEILNPGKLREVQPNRAHDLAAVMPENAVEFEGKTKHVF